VNSQLVFPAIVLDGGHINIVYAARSCLMFCLGGELTASPHVLKSYIVYASVEGEGVYSSFVLANICSSFGAEWGLWS
jgi:hypothetical protein